MTLSLNNRLDVLVDENLDVWFSELNYSPDLSNENSGTFKRKLQSDMMKETLDIQHEVLASRVAGDPPAALLARVRGKVSQFRELKV